MTRPRRAAVAALLSCCCALLGCDLVLAHPAAPAALADTAPGAGAGAGSPASFPAIGQTAPGVQQDGCVKPSAKTTDLTPWAQTFLRPEGAWALSRGAGVTVAVLGSGVDASSGVLDSRLTLGPRLYGEGGAGRDCVGHGTFLAGLIAGHRQPGLGFAGIAPEARILAIAVTDDVGNTSADLLAKGIRAAADGGARVITVGVPVPGAGPELAAAVAYAGARGALVIAPSAPDSTGSGASDSGALPASYPDVLAVSDLGPGGALPQAEAANSGRIDLVAPGDALMSVGPGGAGYFTASGPSLATAVVAGTAALVLGYRPELTPAQLADRLKTTAYHPGTLLPDPRLGYGTVDPTAAVAAALPGKPAPAPSAARTAVAALPPPPARPAQWHAVAVAGGVLVGTALVAGAGAVLSRGRRRGWQPGRWTVDG
ncbi:S8 family serine peptidase [Kitasatospora sp. NPDC057223]|uniref:S8 family serine peptidase n=1 Tax=Kitasatospora sp. NPDC057223 TaxID=3346055 RepID=UPI00362CFC51